MKSVLISIRPEWCKKIASGEKTLEVRKTRPKMDTPFKCYIYCTNKRPFLVWGDVFRGDWETEFTSLYGYSRKEAEKIWDVFNGKVIGEFTCNNILSIGRRGVNNNFDYCYESLSIFGNDDIEPYITAVRKSCLGKNELYEYAKDNPFLYGWHISDPVLYRKPKGLSEFWVPPEMYCEKGLCGGCPHDCVSGESGDVMFDCEWKRPLKRAPQSWCYVEEVSRET